MHAGVATTVGTIFLILLVNGSHGNLPPTLEKYMRYLNCPAADGAASALEQFQAYLQCEQVGAKADEISRFVNDSFNYLDADNSGQVTKSEALARLKQLNATMRVAKVDVDPQKLTTLPEDRCELGAQKEDMQFILCDGDHSGKLSRQEYMRCSVISYGDQMMTVASGENAELSHKETVDIIKAFSQNIYTSMSDDDQLRVINSLHKSPGETFSLTDIVQIDTTLFEEFLRAPSPK